MHKQFRVPITGSLTVTTDERGRRIYAGDPADPVRIDRVVLHAMGDLECDITLVPDSIDPDNRTAIVEVEAPDEGCQRLQALLDDPTVDLLELVLPIPVTHDPEPPLPDAVVDKLVERVGETVQVDSV